ncbi:MAG TPA: hypothetical protein VHQ90_09500 [Thermoanaerobaculia bacterium]|nr:hypothetical protein [Thermoanaerobaculia bacterium]
MKNSNLSIAIDHVAVSGLTAAPRSRAAIGRGVEQAVGRLLAESSLSGLATGAVPEISLRDFRLPPAPTDAQIAEAVAAALHRALGGRSGT